MTDRYCVDGQEWDDPQDDAPLTGDGKYPPFRVFDIVRQDNQPGTYSTREEAQKEADRLNRPTVIWTQALVDATRVLVGETITSPLDDDIHCRAREYRNVAVGYELLPHQVSYTHCLLQRLDTYNERDSHAAFKRAWHEATTTSA